MDLNNKNGQPSMEEILASIRRIIAEEPTAANPVIDLHAKYRQKADDHEDGNDFELPSIFRPAAPAPERQPLFGRLTDAIRSASGTTGNDQKPQRKIGDAEGSDQERYRGALRDAGTILAVSNGNGGFDHAGSNGSGQNGDSERYRGALRDTSAGSLSSALSSLKLTRGGDAVSLGSRPEPEPVHQAPAPAAAPVLAAAPPPANPPAAAPTTASAGGVEDVRRVMVPFRDMRMSRMATDAPTQATAPSAEASAMDALMFSTPPVHEPAPIHHTLAPEFPAPPVQELFAAPLPPPPQTFEDNTLSLDDMHRFAAVMEQPQQRMPPPPPQQAASDAGGIEDTTADLLRPMLRQWLAENMPRMVEKALSIELAQSVKQSRKFNGG